MAIVASVWTMFGLAGDPYFQDPLRSEADPESPRSTDRFVGRARELALVGGQVVGTDPEGSSRTVVEGAPGVGKTSFVNRVKAILVAQKTPLVLAHAQPIRMREDTTPRAFAADVLRTLLLIREEAPAMAEPASAERYWRRIRRLVHGEDTVAGGVSVAGIGASAAPGRIAAEEREGAFYEDVTQAFALLAGKRQRRILIHVNNLENLALPVTAHAARLVQNLRDYFLIPYSHWVFAGATGIDAAVFRAAPQVSGIIPPPVCLGPLTATEVTEALSLRYRALQRGRKLIPPVAPEAIVRLYERYGGDLRNFLRVLSHGVRSAAVAPATPLGAADIVRGVSSEYRRALVAHIGEEGIVRLEAVVRQRAEHPVIRATDVAAVTGIRLDAATRFLASLEAHGVIVRSHAEGRSVYFGLAGNTSVALGVV